MGFFDWFNPKPIVSYNSQYENTLSLDTVNDTTIVEAGQYSKDFATYYYYYGYLINNGVVDITVTFLKIDGSIAGPFTVEPTTRLNISALGILKMAVSEGNATGGTFRYDLVGSTQIPMPGSEEITIIPYIKNLTNSTFTKSGITPNPTTTIYQVSSGYELDIYSVELILNTGTGAGNRRLGLAISADEGALNIYTILADTGLQTGTSSKYYGFGSMATVTDITAYYKTASTGVVYNWGSKQTVSAGAYVLAYAGDIVAGDTVDYYIMGKLVQL